MTSNPLLRIMLIGVLVAVVLWLFWPGSRASNDAPPAALPLDSRLTREELAALGIEGDTPRDTVATLVGQVKQMRRDMEQLSQQNQALAETNRHLNGQAETIDHKIRSAISENRQENDQETSLFGDMMNELKNELQTLQNRQGTQNEIPIGTGFEDNGLPGSAITPLSDELIWQEPLDQPPLKDGNSLLPSSTPASAFSSLSQALGDLERDNPIAHAQHDLRANLKGERDLEQARPVYTIPENATLIGSVAMTAMIGRIPIAGAVSDPYPFKVLVGHDNLTANGIELPDVASAVMSGTATGDWTLSCISAEINSITFVFNDGRVRTIPPPQRSADTDNARRAKLGWLSDPYGIPCIAGERKSNAHSFITTQILMGAAAAAGEAAAAQQTTVTADTQGSSSTVTGNLGRYIAGKAGAGGLNDIRKWAMERYGQMFDAIYVPPGQPVAIHMTREIAIDYEPNGRKVNDESAQSARLDLD